MHRHTLLVQAEGTKGNTILCPILTQLYLEGDKPVKPNSIIYLAAIKACMASTVLGEILVCSAWGVGGCPQSVSVAGADYPPLVLPKQCGIVPVKKVKH
jgi:hypothetical protein